MFTPALSAGRYYKGLATATDILPPNLESGRATNSEVATTAAAAAAAAASAKYHITEGRAKRKPNSKAQSAFHWPTTVTLASSLLSRIPQPPVRLHHRRLVPTDISTGTVAGAFAITAAGGIPNVDINIGTDTDSTNPCAECRAGQYSAKAASFCRPCAAGRYDTDHVICMIKYEQHTNDLSIYLS
jgi:hypothetical protein